MPLKISEFFRLLDKRMNEYQENLEVILDECKQHSKRIYYASQKMRIFMPLTLDKFWKLSEEKIGYIDQFLFRFIKLQDAIASKLFPIILLFLGEDISYKSFIDRLNRLEQLSLISSRYEWEDLGKTRNALAHEYEKATNDSVKYLNEIFQKRDELIHFYQSISQYYQNSIDKH